ncbi:MAG: DnaJ domain-containing protein [Gammaproteobacteria bacterium]
MDKESRKTCPTCGTDNDKSVLQCATCGGSMEASYYDVLGIDMGAGVEVIHKAYRRAAAKYHPDKTASQAVEQRALAEHKMRQLNYIWRVLKNPERREKYLQGLRLRAYVAQHGAAEKEIVDEPQTESPDVPAGVAGVRRAIARLVDYVLFGFVLYALIWLLDSALDTGIWAELNSIVSLLAGDTVLLLALSVIFVSGLTLLWIGLEALQLALFGATMGKSLMRIWVLDDTDEPLGFSAALSRAWSVWLRGMGGGVLFIAPLLWLVWYRGLRQERAMPWDVAAASHPAYDDIKISAYAMALFVLVVPGVALLVVNWPPPGLNTSSVLSATPSPTGPSAGPVTTEPVPVPSGNNVAPAEPTAVATIESRPGPIESPLAPLPELKPVPAPVPDARPIVSVPDSTPASPELKPVPDARPMVPVPGSTSASIESGVAEPPSQPPNQAPAVKPEPLLPPPLRPDYQSTATITGPDFGGVSVAPVSAVPSSVVADRVDSERRVNCMNRYFETMHEAVELPLGDYARLDRAARAELERCLR